ncbi:MAG: hypothetical protein ABII07_00215 [Patescibacteria group bacterium]|nr:hypothetical protein [Patescibacteria group bacterium]
MKNLSENCPKAKKCEIAKAQLCTLGDFYELCGEFREKVLTVTNKENSDPSRSLTERAVEL